MKSKVIKYVGRDGRTRVCQPCDIERKAHRNGYRFLSIICPFCGRHMVWRLPLQADDPRRHCEHCKVWIDQHFMAIKIMDADGPQNDAAPVPTATASA